MPDQQPSFLGNLYDWFTKSILKGGNVRQALAKAGGTPSDAYPTPPPAPTLPQGLMAAPSSNGLLTAIGHALLGKNQFQQNPAYLQGAVDSFMAQQKKKKGGQ